MQCPERIGRVGPVPASSVRPSQCISCLRVLPASGAVLRLLDASAAYRMSICRNICFSWCLCKRACGVWGLRGVGQLDHALRFAQEPASIVLVFAQVLPGIAIWLHSRLYHLRCCTVFCSVESIARDKAAKVVTAEDPLYHKLHILRCCF